MKDNGKLVRIESHPHGERAVECDAAFDPQADYAMLYPDGQFRRIILDADGFRELRQEDAATALSPDDLGRISYLIGKRPESIPAAYLPGYLRSKEDAEAKEAAWAAEILADEAAHPDAYRSGEVEKF